MTLRADLQAQAPQVPGVRLLDVQAGYSGDGYWFSYEYQDGTSGTVQGVDQYGFSDKQSLTAAFNSSLMTKGSSHVQA